MKLFRRYFITIVSSLLLFSILYLAINSVAKDSQINEKKSLEQALYRGVLECYALEGSYPESLAYLRKEYHVVYDEQKYDIDYEIIASNMIPNITIIEK